MRIDVPRAIVMYLLWLGLTAGALLVAMADGLPVKLGFIRPDSVFTLLIEAELFFVLFIWPFFVPRLHKPVTIDASRLGTGAHLLVLQVIVLFVVALPVALLCTNLADIGTGEFLRGHLLVAVLATFVATLHDAATERGATLAPWYFLAAFIVAGGAPFADYLRWSRGGTPGLLSHVSPFWTGARLDGAAPLIMTAVFAAATIGLMAAVPFLKRRQAQPA